MKEIGNEFYEKALLLGTAYLIYRSLGIDLPVDNGMIDGEALAEELKKKAPAARTACGAQVNQQL